MDRARRREEVNRAYDVQVRAGTEGALRYTSIGIGLAILGHYTWPLFRVADVSLVTIWGLVSYAERALQSLEINQRQTESVIRKEARIELSRRGIVPTETAIAQWKEARAREQGENAPSRTQVT
ncbi:hypothetical protein PHLCEN_2v10537 [Hermanssonia centrifuga]|uniref:Uncharacterized protein n=1 Tax=Hermanssonia centrifuga TaxID=98765 RepID=A0A2R6NMK4_9APHY|nr:hypothetical protein PHLCEN_2v10537 [Hermanssonia centrifuga]